MKINEKYKWISVSVNEYNSTFKRNLIPRNYSNKFIEELMRKYPYWTMIEESFCCHGLDNSCWQEVYDESVLGMTLECVKKDVVQVLKNNAKELRRHPRFFVEERNGCVDLLVVLRDTDKKCDYKITGSLTRYF